MPRVIARSEPVFAADHRGCGWCRGKGSLCAGAKLIAVQSACVKKLPLPICTFQCKWGNQSREKVKTRALRNGALVCCMCSSRQLHHRRVHRVLCMHLRQPFCVHTMGERSSVRLHRQAWVDLVVTATVALAWHRLGSSQSSLVTSLQRILLDGAPCSRTGVQAPKGPFVPQATHLRSWHFQAQTHICKVFIPP